MFWSGRWHESKWQQKVQICRPCHCSCLRKTKGPQGRAQSLTETPERRPPSHTHYSRIFFQCRCHAGPGNMPSDACANGGTLTEPCPGAARSDKIETNEPFARAEEQDKPLPMWYWHVGRKSIPWSKCVALGCTWKWSPFTYTRGSHY